MPSLGNDLAAIRKELDLTIEDIHEATKIPIHILHSIEDDTIFKDLDQNATYIRSYVRTYAKKLYVDKEKAILALDQVELGSYNGLLRGNGDGEKPHKLQGKVQEEKEKEVKPKDSNEQKKQQERPVKKERKQQKSRQTPQNTEEPPAEAPTVKSVDWVDMGKKFTPMRPKSQVWAGIAVLIVVVISVAGIIYYLNTENTVEDPAQEENVPVTTTEAVEPDSLQLNLSNPTNTQDTAQNVQTRPATELADTLNLVIYAAYEKLEPVRVYTDVMASLNPYWIEVGEAVKFKFVNTIRIRGPYERMVLLLNGHVIENFREQFINQESGLVEINRSAFEGESKWLQPPPDSLGLDVPDPTVIKDQPIFN